MKVAIVWALLMFGTGDDANNFKEAEEFMLTDGMSKCLSLKREATRNTAGSRIIFKCIQAEVELEILEVDKSLHINKIIREVK